MKIKLNEFVSLPKLEPSLASNKSPGLFLCTTEYYKWEGEGCVFPIELQFGIVGMKILGGGGGKEMH